ncbi:MAG: M20/M25/M40 family metallo-hydrolase, partial [Pontixanthobacter sp.]
MLRWSLALLVIAAAIFLGWFANRLPTPTPETAPATEFSAARAMDDVGAIAIAPHPIGSQEIKVTRQYLIARMTALGLAPEMRDQTVVVTRRTSADLAIGGRVRNIIGELKGSDPALPAVVLMAHYDTAPLSPGAGDDTAGVSVALEVARALKAGGTLRRSVIFLITDGEEAGLLGANAFFQSDPLRKRVGPVVNLEARGDSGRALMFQTSTNNRALIEAYRRTISEPASDSLMVTIYKRMPNDTDLTAALERHYVGMNFAFVGHQMAYHTPLSTAKRLNPGSIQHMGDQVLPILRDFA